MATYRIVSLPAETADSVRATRKAPRYGHPAHTETAKGHGPCRQCLRTFRVGAENRILFTWDCFAGREEIPLPGPVFIHENPCMPYPPDGGYPPELKPYPVILDAFANGQLLVERVLAGAEGDKEAAVAKLLARTEVDYIDVRDGNAGCFDFRIERA